MKHLTFSVIFLLITTTTFAQKPIANEYSMIDKKALLLPDSLTKTTDQIATYILSNFKTDTEKARAIFVWVASNIEYDVDNMYALNFYKDAKQKIEKPLLTRKGICENYASLFTEICKKSGLKSYVITGYTMLNGMADYMPHAWSAAQIDGKWFIFDPTWGSGYIYEDLFVRKIDNTYFKANPKFIIKSHMPFDYLWQFLNYPITNQEFYQGKTQENKTKPYFNFIDTLAAYEKLDTIDQLLSEANRIERNGVKNSMVFDRLQHLKLKATNDRMNQVVFLYNSSVVNYNEGINAFNDFINYRNKQFMPVKTDSAIKSMLDKVDNNFKEALTKIAKISNPEPNLASMINQLNKNIDEASVHLKEQQVWLQSYFSKSKLVRKTMFYKINLYGIPLN